MQWSNLKLGLCPQCGAKLVMGFFDSQYPCSERCGFLIGKEKFETIAYGRHMARIVGGDEESNLSELNNLGHDVVTEDFSDSPYKNRE